MVRKNIFIGCCNNDLVITKFVDSFLGKKWKQLLFVLAKTKKCFPITWLHFHSLSPFGALLFHGLIESQISNYFQNNDKTTNLDVALIWCEILDKK